MKKLFLTFAIALLAINAMADVRGDLKTDPRISANNYRAYPDTQLPQLTPAPVGYAPFYIDHYGRHGS
ncbi:MAG: histidine-type phosphatase, partial [Muribaculaceae bacterium]|nr:histidine-type phosphatase [Muribaculaceae bacterium]